MRPDSRAAANASGKRSSSDSPVGAALTELVGLRSGALPPTKWQKPGSSSLIRATINRIWRICRSLELPKRRTRPSETFSERAVKASVVLSQRSLSSSIAPLAPRK